MNATTITSKILRPPKPWTAPSITMPFPIDAHDLHPIGTDRVGRSWFTHPLGELSERPRRYSDEVVLPNAPLVVEIVGDERQYRAFDVYAPGSFEARQATVAHVRIPPKPGLVDQLGGVRQLGPKTEFRGGSFRGPIRGAAKIVAHLSKLGDGAQFIPDPGTTDGFLIRANGKPYPSMVDAALRARVLIGPFLHGHPAACRFCGAEAETVAAVDVPWCGSCAGPKGGKA